MSFIDMSILLNSGDFKIDDFKARKQTHLLSDLIGLSGPGCLRMVHFICIQPAEVNCYSANIF